MRIYSHTERHERSYGEVKLWVVFAKIFSKPQSYSRKVEETEVNTVPLQLAKQFMVDTSKFTGKGKASNNLYAGAISYEVGSALVLAFTRGRAKNKVWGILAC